MRQCAALLALVCVGLQLAYISAAAATDKVDCGKLDEMLDDLASAQSITALNDKYKLQTTSEEQVKRCSEMADAIKMLRKYNKECFTSLTQQVLSAILRTRAAFNEAHCKEVTSVDFVEGLETAKCVAQNALESVKQAENKVIVSFQVLQDANISDDKLRVRRACCAVLDAKRIFLAAAREKCAKHEKTLNDYVDSYTSEAMGLICPEADKLECGKLEAIKTEGVAPRYKSFLTPMVKVVKTLDH